MEFWYKDMFKRERLFHFWFNTFFIPTSPSPLMLTKSQLDKANKDRECRIFAADFRVELLFSNPDDAPSTSGNAAAPSTHPTTSSSGK